MEMAGSEDDVIEPLYPESEIRKRLNDIALRLKEDYPTTLFLICVLKGASIFHSDLIREVNRVGGPSIFSEYVRARSYDKTESSGRVEIDEKVEVTGKDVVIIEDIVDTGRTAKALKELFLKKGAASVRLCTLLDKQSRRTVQFNPDYCAFPDTPDAFLVGYGLDYEQRYRELPFIAILHTGIR